MKFIYLGACETGKDDTGSDNLVDALYSKGVDTVIGFTIQVRIDQTNLWSKAFMLSLANGNSISQALNAADKALQNAGLGTSTVSAEYRYILGPTNVVLYETGGN